MAGPRLIAALLLMLWLCSNPFGTQTRKGLDYGNRGYVREADTPTDSCHNLCHDPERVERKLLHRADFFLDETDFFGGEIVLGVNFDEIMRVTRATGFFKWHKSRNLHSISLKIRIRWQ